MDCFVRVFYGGSVSKEECLFEGMEKDLVMFDKPPSLGDLLLRLEGRFGGNLTLKGRFDVGTTRSRYVIMPLVDEDHWFRYTRVLQGCNAKMAEVVLERSMNEDDGP